MGRERRGAWCRGHAWWSQACVAVCGVADVGAPMRFERMPRTLLTRLPCYSALELCPHRSAQIAMSPIIDPDHRCGLGRLETVGARDGRRRGVAYHLPPS
jgi:hypothetical protein